MANVLLYADTETVSTLEGYTWRYKKLKFCHLLTLLFQTRDFLFFFCGTQMEMLHRIFFCIELKWMVIFIFVHQRKKEKVIRFLKQHEAE